MFWQQKCYKLIIEMRTKSQKPLLKYQEQNYRAKLSIATIYPIELPKVKFYTERAIHQDPQPNHKLLPINFMQYLKHKHNKRYSRNEDCDSKEKEHHESMYITNSFDKEKGVGKGTRQKRIRNQTVNIDRFRCKSQMNEDLRIFADKTSGKEEKSKIIYNYYKRKYLKYKCRKSIELELGKEDSIEKTIKNLTLLTNGLKIEKIEIPTETPSQRTHKQLINKAKFNTIVNKESYRSQWQITPWHFHSEIEGEI